MKPEMTEKTIYVKDYVTKSNLPASDFVINPYIGCPHGCKYCYASFMKRFTNHKEDWGTFIDIKQCDKPISAKRLAGKSVFLSSVTDCYNSYEETYQITRKILEQLVEIPCELVISTKSKLILRDLELLKKCRNLKVSMSINTLDEEFRKDMDYASPISERLDTLRKLHQEGINTILFMSPIFPGLTDFKSIIEASKDFINEYWFENLNLRGNYKQTILSYIKEKHPQHMDLYNSIYLDGDKSYWEYLAIQITKYCNQQQICYKNYFYHEELVAKKQEISTAKKNLLLQEDMI